MAGKLDSVFFTKYNEFCEELKEAFPERRDKIIFAKTLTNESKLARFKTEVLPTAGDPKRDPEKCPGTVLPGVTIPDAIWTDLSLTTQKAIQQYLTLLCFCCQVGSGTFDAKWAEEMLNGWKDKLDGVDFTSFSQKIMGMFSSGGLPKMPERLLKGQLAKLAEELVKEFTPEDFGMSAAEMAAAGDSPTRAFELLSKIYTERPEIMQNAMKKIAKRLQEKVQRGELRPQEMAKEAEELMKEFTENPEMVSLMESFRGMFGFEDKEAARAVGRDGENRLSIVQARLRKKLEEKKKKRQGGGK
jgi:hypothetical protein